MAMVAGSIATYMHITKTCVAACHLYNYMYTVDYFYVHTFTYAVIRFV